MWLLAKYRPVGLFSLKVGLATSTGAKSLLLPSPFAVRTALLDAAIRIQGLEAAPEIFKVLKGLDIAAFPPKQVVVTNLFAKVLKPQRADAESEEPMQQTIAFREYVYLAGELGLAFHGSEESLEVIEPLLPHVSYFGKRGSFFQLVSIPVRVPELPEGFVVIDNSPHRAEQSDGAPAQFPLGVIQVMDDWGPDLTFEKLNIYTDEVIRLGRDRVRESVILPYHPVRSSRSFTYYERLN